MLCICCVRFVLCELRRVLVRVRTENARSSSPPPRRPSQPDADFDAACAAERRRCAAESLGPDCACLLGADDNGLRFPAAVEAGAFEAMVRHMTGSPELRAAVLEWFVPNANASPREYVLARPERRLPRLAAADERQRALGLAEWRRALGAVRRGLYEACAAMRYAEHVRQIRAGILGRVGRIDSHSMKRRVREIFDEFDADGSGSVDREELRRAFARLDVAMGEADLDRFVAEFDLNCNGLIEFEEFLLMVCLCACARRNAQLCAWIDRGLWTAVLCVRARVGVRGHEHGAHEHGSCRRQLRARRRAGGAWCAHRPVSPRSAQSADTANREGGKNACLEACSLSASMHASV